MFNSIPPPEPPRRVHVAKPLIGLAVSICLAVASFLAGAIAICGTPGNGYNGGGATVWTFTSALLITISCIAAVSIVVCFVWFVVALVRGSGDG